jgi:hypothetical protein
MNADKEFHRELAASLFNCVWDLMGKANRTQEDNDEMIHAAHASRYHWGEAGTAVNLARGEWQISRVYAVLNRPEPALYHAQRCMEITHQHEIGDFDLAYAYEAMARAIALRGDRLVSEHYLRLAKEAGDKIVEQEDKILFFSDLATVPGYDQLAMPLE